MNLHAPLLLDPSLPFPPFQLFHEPSHSLPSLVTPLLTYRVYSGIHWQNCCTAASCSSTCKMAAVNIISCHFTTVEGTPTVVTYSARQLNPGEDWAVVVTSCCSLTLSMGPCNPLCSQKLYPGRKLLPLTSTINQIRNLCLLGCFKRMVL